jgi:hypothetical protein
MTNDGNVCKVQLYVDHPNDVEGQAVYDRAMSNQVSLPHSRPVTFVHHSS